MYGKDGGTTSDALDPKNIRTASMIRQFSQLRSDITLTTR